MKAAVERKPVEVRGDGAEFQLRGERYAIVVEIVVETEGAEAAADVHVLANGNGDVDA